LQFAINSKKTFTTREAEMLRALLLDVIRDYLLWPSSAIRTFRDQRIPYIRYSKDACC
jgi:hypothetical protein